jgi:2-deoxy-D-gluconate 3-dehydrogenase
MCQEAGKVMLKKGKGKIINVASMISFFGGQTIAAYAAAKGGITQLTKALSNDWAGRGINVNAIAPGYMATDLNSALLANEERLAQINARIPAGRWGTPDDIAKAVVALCDGTFGYTTGQSFIIDGGMHIRKL